MRLRLRNFDRLYPLRAILLLVFVLGVGLGARSLLGTDIAHRLTGLFQWAKQTTVSLYFTDSSGRYLVPVSRQMAYSDDLPRRVLVDLLAGPDKNTGLGNPVPTGTVLRSFSFDNGVVRADFSAAFLTGRPEIAQTAIVETLATLSGVHAITFSVEGNSLGSAMRRIPLLYFASTKGLWAVSATASNPRAALDAYLAGPPDPGLTGLPPDIHILTYQFDPANGLLSINFSYTASIHEFALNHPDTMRQVLTGLIASLTNYPDVQAVQIDFEGHTRLGLGECSDLLRAPQARPAVLNDERLLSR